MNPNPRFKLTGKAAALIMLIAAAFTTKTAAAQDWQSSYASLLKKYATSSGVRYASWKSNAADLASLKSVVDAIAKAPLPSARDSQLSHLLNAYNAWILHNVLEDYPVKGVGGGNALGRNAFFSKKSITVDSRRISFNDLEHEWIRKRFKEPRIHFALNCASGGCPPLMNRPFTASSLDADLTRLTRAFVNDNPHGVRVSGGTYTISEIFKWFEEDFGDVVTYINRYRTQKIPSGAKVRHHDYDWSLNEAR